MSDDWAKDFEEAQAQTRYIIAGQEFERICYGDEADDWGADKGPCHDCRQYIYCGCEDAKDS